MEVTPELTNATKVLIARMDTHPDDFTMGKFNFLSDSLNALLEVTEGGVMGRGYLKSLPAYDLEVLREAWRKVLYTKFEKQVMDTLFREEDDERVNSQGVAIPSILASKQNNAALRNAAQNAAYTHPFGAIGSNNVAAQGYLGANNDSGFFTGLTGIFK